MPGRDTRTRYQGLFARHQAGCGVEGLPPKSTLTAVAYACDCRPSYYGKVYDRTTQRFISTRRQRTTAAARNERKDLVKAMESGQFARHAPERLREVHRRCARGSRPEQVRSCLQAVGVGRHR
jgi:hypothetical protein